MAQYLVLTDLHWEFHPERKNNILKNFNHEDTKGLVLCGDLGNDLDTINHCLTDLTQQHGYQDKDNYFVPGNHDYWATAGDPEPLMELVAQHGFKHPEPYELWTQHGDWLLYNLFYEDWGNDPNTLMETRDHQYFPVWNFQRTIPQGITMPEVIVSISHLPPRQEYSGLRHSSELGRNLDLEQLIYQSKAHTHLFGHSHEPVNETHNNVRFINNPFGYKPNKQKARTWPYIVDIDT